MKISEVLNESFLAEAKEARTPHPEDSVFGGLGPARDAVNSMYHVINNPETLTIKWDGFLQTIVLFQNKGLLFVLLS